MTDLNHYYGMLDRAVAEKYLHSMGAALYDAGRFDEAVSFFEEALLLDDRPYTRCHLGLCFKGKNDLDRACAEMTRAIELLPEAEYYHRRSGLWRMRGDRARADADYEEAVRLDPNYRRIERIRAGARLLGRAIEDVSPEERSCIVPCPAYCCHFSHEPVVHGVYIGPWKLRAIRGLLGEKGLDEGAFFKRMVVREEERYARLIPPDVVVKEKGRGVVFFPNRGRRPLGRRLLHDLPQGQEYVPLAWITKGARPCAFLEGGRCVIHDSGDEPALCACKEFFCLTGLVFFALARMGLARRADIETKGMGELNRIAVEALLVVSERHCRGEGTAAMKGKIYNMMRYGVEKTTP
ncbi:MAG: tetratricopeptide repeat protein [Syntrophorhabdales bacterium]